MSIQYRSSEYRQLQSLLSDNLNYQMFAYPGSDKPRLKIINSDGLTVLYADFDTVIGFVLNILDTHNIPYKLGG